MSEIFESVATVAGLRGTSARTLASSKGHRLKLRVGRNSQHSFKNQDAEIVADFLNEIPVQKERDMIIGYASSTEGQGVEGQIASLKLAGADKIFSEKVSGVVTDRRDLRRAIDGLTCGDLLIVTKLDRLARSTRDLLNTLATVTEKQAGFRVLDNPAMDTTSAHSRLLLNILGSIAEFERANQVKDR